MDEQLRLIQENTQEALDLLQSIKGLMKRLETLDDRSIGTDGIAKILNVKPKTILRNYRAKLMPYGLRKNGRRWCMRVSELNIFMNDTR